LLHDSTRIHRWCPWCSMESVSISC
jgi:hypothetical protein